MCKDSGGIAATRRANDGGRDGLWRGGDGGEKEEEAELQQLSDSHGVTSR